MELAKQNWPDKYDINRLVTIQNDVDKIIGGKKTSVRRNDRYADPGDSMTLNGRTVIVEHVFPQKLREITDDDARQEGYSDLEEYKSGITSIHGEDVWDPEQVVWAHELKVA
ncbi:hypothetical protein GCM10008983_01730 [Lentibacillus halophilus]|uniref:ASCH domain-containing protein n=1 Tax=Lentibacillus halophilus TaxID=295065 RepID=A0ABP3IVH0_9BACI